jgi:hypothetical protein
VSFGAEKVKEMRLWKMLVSEQLQDLLKQKILASTVPHSLHRRSTYFRQT